jgi:hypothetical protein
VQAQAIRAIAYYNASAVDRSRVEPDAKLRQAARGLADLLTPITKSYSTDQGVEMASLAIQVFGGMGFIEETGAAQHYRDIRIAPIYEGTNGIQALDLIGRKMHADNGVHWRALLDELLTTVAALPAEGDVAKIRGTVALSLSLLKESAEKVMNLDPAVAAGIASPFLKMFGITLGAALLAKQAGVAAGRLASGQGDAQFLKAKIATASFFVEDLLPQAAALRASIELAATTSLYAISEEQFAL